MGGEKVCPQEEWRLSPRKPLLGSKELNVAEFLLRAVAFHLQPLIMNLIHLMTCRERPWGWQHGCCIAPPPSAVFYAVAAEGDKGQQERATGPSFSLQEAIG